MNDQTNEPTHIGEAVLDMLRDEFGIDVAMEVLLHPEQRALTWGSTYAIFSGLDMPGEENHFIIYGMVPSQEQVIRKTREMGVPPETRATMLRLMQEKLDKHRLIGATFSVHTGRKPRDGEVAKVIAWPIPREVFDAAANADFDWDRMDVGTQAHLGIACAAWRTHKQVSGADL